MDLYRITQPGATFVNPDNTTKTTGDVIRLASDVAASHAGVLTPLTAEEAAEFEAAELAQRQAAEAAEHQPGADPAQA